MSLSIDWIKLERGNDWGKEFLGHEDYSFDSSDVRTAIPFKTGDPVCVRFQSGAIQEHTIVMIQVSEEVDDHGKSYPVTSSIPVFYVDYEGICFMVNLDEVEIARGSVELAAYRSQAQ